MRIVEYPHPALRHAAVAVRHVDKNLRLQIGRMFELMYDARGLGLAGPQVALPYQLLVMNLAGDSEKTECEKVFLNPRIVSRKGTMTGEEGCLSFPGLYAKVTRSRQIVVEAFDLDGQPVTIQASDLESRCWQHEIEHLEGKLFIERFSTVARIAKHHDIAIFEKKFRRAQESGTIDKDADLQKLLQSLELEMSRG